MVAKIFIVRRRLVSFIVMIARSRPRAITVSAPCGLIALAKIHLAPFWIGIVPHGKHRSGDAVQQFGRGLSFLVTTARDIARADKDRWERLARYSSGIAEK